ncbi:hypothetical protein WN943_022863 [Citrus x changshan-huyou]
MELTHHSWVSCWAAWLATLAVILIPLHLLRRRKLNLPPGPKSWPIIGNLNLIMGPAPHRFVDALCKKYGPIVQLKFGSFPVVVCSSVQMAKAILKSHDAIFAYRPKMASGKYTGYNFSNITWSPYGPYFNQARKICTMELFTAKRLKSYEHIRVEELNVLLKHLYESSGKPIALKDHLADVSLNVISRVVLGKKYSNERQNGIEITRHELKEMIDELILLNGVFDIGDSIPWLGFLDLQGNIKRMKAVAKKFDRFLEQVVDEHNARRKGIDNYVAKDMVDVLLLLADDPTLEVKLDRHSVKGFTLDLIAGATETSTLMLEWAFAELVKNPEILDKATEELDRVIGKERWFEEKDIVNLPFIEAIIKETMRLHGAPMLMPRMAREDCKVAAYDILKGTQVLVNTWTIERDPALWENPNEFCPERFLGKSIDVKGNDFELLPFGAGRRMCPGYSHGLKVIQSSLANLLHGFTWKLPGNMSNKELNMEEVFKLANQKKIPLEVVAQPRLAPHLYNV